MGKLIVTGFTILCLFNIVAHGETAVPASGQPYKYKEETGMAVGGLLGGLIAGPPGAIIGIAGGAWLGDQGKQADKKISGLENDVARKNTELTIMEQRFSELQQQFGNELQKVATENRTSSLKDLSNGVSLAVYFRSGSNEIGEETRPRIEKLATFLKQFPEIRMLVEGYADKHGDAEYNRELGLKRAKSVESALVQAGISQKRILTHTYGESRAQSPETDAEGNALDRRVSITLTLNAGI